MADRGVVFVAEMVRAMLAGRKTQTRRLATADQLANGAPWQVGDRLWVREGFRFWAVASDDAEVTFLADGRRWQTGPCTGEIVADQLATYFKLCDRSQTAGKAVTRTARYAPRWASRITLDVTEVRAHRLQAISREDCAAEGHVRADQDLPEDVHLDAARDWYMDLWDKLYREPGTRWADDPWVFAYTFGVRVANIDRREP